MSKPDDLSDILGTESQDTRKAAKSARLKALAPSTKENTVPPKAAAVPAPAAPARVRTRNRAAAAPAVPAKPARAAKDVKGNAAKPPKAAAAAATNGAGTPRRKPEFAEGESDNMLAQVKKVMAKNKKINSKELAAKIGYEGQMHKVRPVLARAVSAGILEIKPGASPAEGTTLVAK